MVESDLLRLEIDEKIRIEQRELGNGQSGSAAMSSCLNKSQTGAEKHLEN